MRQRLRIKANGGLIAWTCVFLDHRYGAMDEIGWKPCVRRGCTAQLQADKRQTERSS